MLTTQHKKSMALEPPFRKILGASLIENNLDTDQLGTFTGEIERKDTMLETAKKKCEWGLKFKNAEYALASEGSFGPHPFIPFLASDKEILYFIDKKRDFQLYITELFTETNYRMAELSCMNEVLAFAEKALFPSHALILRPFPLEIKAPIFKGLQTKEELEVAFLTAIRASPIAKIWVETDMRASFNPTRMKMIGSLGEKLADRLSCLCPECSSPGWGMVDIEAGLQCCSCGTPTDLIKSEIFGCTKCEYREQVLPRHGKEKADPGQCPYCNP